MTLFSYEIFDAVARQGSFNKAAQQLHLTPSAISHAIAVMEEELGFALFNRGKNGVSMTSYGASLYPSIRDVLNSDEALKQSIARLNGLEKGKVKLGVFNSVCASLLPGLLQSVAYNEAHGTPNVHLYEVGSLFHGRENASLPKETKSVAGVLSGQWSEQSWSMKYRKLRFFFGKGIVEELLAQLRIEKVRFRPVEGEGYAFLQPGRAAEVLSGGTVLGWVGEIHPEAREAMGIDEVVVAFELDLDKLIKGARNQENYREFSQYPAVEHDLAIVVDNAVTCEDLERRITSAGGKLLEGVRLFDVYRDPIRVGAGKKSMAFALTYRSDDHTLTSEEVEKAHQKIVTKVCKGVNGEVRG